MSLRYRHLNFNISPQIKTGAMRDQLRERFQNRIRANRGTLLDIFRSSGAQEPLKDTLKDMLSEDFNAISESQKEENVNEVDFNMNEALELLDEIEKELVDHELKWLSDEYERTYGNVDGDYIENFHSEVICPICLRNPLTMSPSPNGPSISCANCNISLRTDKNLSQLKDDISAFICVHNTSCFENAQFSFTSDANDRHLYMLCESCSFMAVIL